MSNVVDLARAYRVDDIRVKHPYQWGDALHMTLAADRLIVVDVAANLASAPQPWIPPTQAEPGA